MNIVKAALTELLGLFVDDGSLAVAVIVWIAGAVICMRGQFIDPQSEAVLLFAGIAVLLAENVVRSTRARVVANPNA
jgi:hypothetical protein